MNFRNFGYTNSQKNPNQKIQKKSAGLFKSLKLMALLILAMTMMLITASLLPLDSANADSSPQKSPQKLSLTKTSKVQSNSNYCRNTNRELIRRCKTFPTSKYCYDTYTKYRNRCFSMRLCTMQYAPQCGRNPIGMVQAYPNMCWLQADAAQYYSRGTCSRKDYDRSTNAIGRPQF